MYLLWEFTEKQEFVTATIPAVDEKNKPREIGLKRSDSVCYGMFT